MIKPDDPLDSLNLAIDRLIDGCLGESERRELLLRIESEPDGWRRCALAFLEEQTWRSALVGMVPTKLEAPIVVPTQKRRRRPLFARRAVAASVIALTFAIGFVSGGAAHKPDRLIVAESPVIPAPKSNEVNHEVREVGWINVVDPLAGESPPARVPILSGPGIDEKWLRDQPPSVSDYVKAQWQRQGYQVEERRRLVSVVLDDGRRVSIPVDEVAVEYVGQHPL